MLYKQSVLPEKSEFGPSQESMTPKQLESPSQNILEECIKTETESNKQITDLPSSRDKKDRIPILHA